MNRILVFIVVVAAAVVTVATPQREPYVTPLPVDDTAVEAAEVEAARSVARCPWVRGDGFMQGSVAVAAPAASQATVTVASSGAVVGTAEVPIDAFAKVPFLELASLGTGSAFVEFDAAPAAAVAVGEGDVANATAGCRSGASKSWLLAGGSTLDGEALQLRLFNPFPQDARVEIRVVSENDEEPETSLESITVAAQSTATFDLGSLLTLRETLALAIADPEGLIAPSFVQSAEIEDEAGNEVDVDIAAWTGVTGATRWEFPFASVDGLDSSITLFNDQAVPVQWQLDLVDEDGVDAGAAGGTLEPLTVTRVHLADLVDAPAGAVITADEPMGAFLTGVGPTQRAATSGVRSATQRWLVPGPGAMAGPSRVWIMNLGATTATVTYTPAIDGRLAQPDKITVPAGSIRSFSVTEDLIVESQQPVSVGWVRSSGTAAAFTVGIPVADG